MLEHLSYSSITTFLDCPENWQRKYIKKEPTQSSPALVFGSAFHETVEKLVTTPDLDVLSTWTSAWNKAIENQNVFWGSDTPEETHNDGVKMFSNKALLSEIRSIRPGVDEKGPKIERFVQLKVPGVPIPVIGYIDIILEDGTPADFKTSSRSWSDDKAADSLQGLFYLAALNQAGIETSGKFKHIIFVKTKEPKVQMLENTHKPGELFFLFELIQRVWKSIETGIFPLNPTSWKCNDKYCDFYANCRGKYA